MLFLRSLEIFISSREINLLDWTPSLQWSQIDQLCTTGYRLLDYFEFYSVCSCSYTQISNRHELPLSIANKNQRTSGPVNAHLTPDPGIYFNAFIHVYSPRAGAENPLGTNVDVNRKPISLCPFVASFKTISLKYDFKHILNFIHVYSPVARAENPLVTNF